MSEAHVQFDDNLDKAFHDAINNHVGVARYSSKFDASNYRGFVFLLPDWRVYEFHIWQKTYQDLILQQSNKKDATSTLIKRQIANITALLSTPKNNENPLHPIFSIPSTSWKLESKTRAAELIKAFRFSLTDCNIQEQIRFFTTPLRFYNNAKLIAFNSESNDAMPRWHYFIELIKDDNKINYYTLNGLSAPIHDCNTLLNIQLKEKDVLDYLRFFCFFIQSQEGSFYVIGKQYDSNIPSVMWDESFIHNGKPLQLLKLFKSPRIIEATLDGFLCEATIYNGNSLSISEMKVQKNGQISMQNSNNISQTLPYKLKGSE